MINKIKQNWILISVMLFFTILIFTIHFNYVSAIEEINAKADIELQEAKKPSLVEIQKADLIKKETEWRDLESELNNHRQKIQEIEEYKQKVENEIREKRNEILWISK